MKVILNDNLNEQNREQYIALIDDVRVYIMKKKVKKMKKKN